MRKHSFTLVELLVVMAILSILAGLLLPALNSAIREARKIECVGNLKQIGSGLLMYANDNDAYYPAEANPTFGPMRRWPHVPASKEGSFDYDIRPLMMPYYGDTLNGVFVCPLADTEWREKDLDTIWRSRVPYSLFFGKIDYFTNPISTAATGNPNGWDVVTHNDRVGRYFTLGTSYTSAAGRGKKFSLLASDYIVRREATRTYSTHPSPSGGSFGVGEVGNSSGGRWWQTSLGEGVVDASFLADDGAVSSYSGLHCFSGGNNDESVMYRAGRNDRESHLLPVDKAK